ncbi:hypothetical protein DH2020_015675 [Rehmannia glutinosa]|uniref:Cytochrome P450 protein n=1 Tax=Rehmannia glutinosa TaxID=99300 RepID=A0ABR0WTA5_REHGL
MEYFGSSIYAAIAFFFLYYLLWPRSAKPKIGAPPEASGARPFTGHLHLMPGGSSAELPHINLASLADKHGPIFTIRLGVRRALVVSSWELAKELFTTCDVAVSSRPRLRAAKHLSHEFAMFGFAPYGAYWRGLRKPIAVELLSNRRIELQRNVRVSETEQSTGELYKLWKEKKDESGRVLVDMKKWFGDLNLNVVLRVVAGKRFNYGGGGDAEETKRCREVFRDFFHFAGMFVAADAMPYLVWLDLGGHEKKMKENAKEMDEIVGGWLAEHRNKGYSDEDKPQDFMDVMLSVVQGADLHDRYDADTIIKATCETLISGGTDTTTVMLVWALSLLLNNRHVLKEAQEELDKHIGRERRVKESDISNLVYLQAITKETLRLYPAGPFATREFTENCHVGGYHVQKGTWLIVNLWKLHRDPHVWGDDLLEFKPERFLSTHKNVDVRGQNFELIPFGTGRRSCPGTNFGLQMLHLVLANLLHAFEVSTVSDDVVDMTESAGLTNIKATQLDVLVAPRLSPSLY